MGSQVIQAVRGGVIFCHPYPMADEKEQGVEIDERSIARKYGLRELVYPEKDHLKSLTHFLTGVIDTGRCGPIPKTAVVMTLDFLQGVVNRQHLTKPPHMSQKEFDALTTPYYLAARIVTKLVRDKQLPDEGKGKVYHTTYNALGQFIELLRSLLDPGCYWLRLKTVPEGISESMQLLRAFLLAYPSQREKGRAM
jgi:hypothetical protein